MKVKVPARGLTSEVAARHTARWADHDLREKGLSKSTSVGTRKMVNYARVE